MEKVLVHYAEIALKGRNRAMFENRLVDNIKKSAAFQKVELKGVKKSRGIVICEFDDKRDNVISVLKAVFGIRYFCFIEEVKKDAEVIVKKVKGMLEQIKAQGDKSVAFKTKRGDKGFPLTSVEMNTQFGEIANQLGLKVDYKNSLKRIFVEIGLKKVFVYSERINGFGGLPVGTSGKVLCLLSGGIDSPVAAWQVMKRGCTVDFLHLHNLKSNTEVEKSKIMDLVNTLNKYQFKSKLHVVPYTLFEFAVMDKIPRQHELVFFKHYLLKLAEKLALSKRYKAIVTGDSLSQVASQTLDNLKAASCGISMPIFRPLLTFDKEDIVESSKKIGLFDLSVKEYKDCCSIVSKGAQTNTNFEEFKKVISGFDMDKLISESVDGSKALY